MDTIQIDGWQGRLGQGLAPRQLMATMHAAADLQIKEIARKMNCAPSTTEKTLDRAKFNLSSKGRPIRTIRALCIEAMRRGIIAPLMVALLVGGGNIQQMRPVRRPESPRIQTVVRIQRLDDAQLAA